MLRCFNPRADRDDFDRVTPNVDSVPDLGVKSVEGERNAEKIAAVPTLAMGASAIKAKTQLYDSRLTMDNDSQRFVRELARRSVFRRKIAELVKEHSLGGEDGATHILAYINDSNHAVPSLLALRKAMDQMKADDLMMWASRYNLFVLWSSDRQHPWDSLPNAGRVAATLEIGKMAGSADEYLVMVDGQRIKHFEFKNSILKTLEPVQWVTPSGEQALVHLELRMSTFFGYSNSGDVASELAKLRYLGSQCHGIMWPAAEMATLPDWPVAPPIVAGKVNVTHREAALSPPSSDSLSAFAGEFVTYILPDKEGYPAAKTRSLTISTDSTGAGRVAMEGELIQDWTFGPNNTLTFNTNQGFGGWLQFVHLPGSPIIVGKICEYEADSTQRFNVYGEAANIISRLPPSSAIDTVVNEFVTTNLGVASTVLLADVLAAAERLWSMPRTSVQDEEAANEHMHAINRLGQKVAAVLFLEDLCLEGETTFMQVNSKGAILPPKDVDPNSTQNAKLAMEAARDNAEVTKQATLKAGEEAAETQIQFQECNATMATYKASQATWKAAQAGEAAGATEACANQAASEARQARTAEALGYALSAAQYYNEARVQAAQAALAGHKAAEFALRAVEGGIEHYAKSKNFEKLKEIAEASGVATKAVQQAQAAAEGWADNIVASRASAIDTAKAASEHAQACFKHMRRVQPAKEEGGRY